MSLSIFSKIRSNILTKPVMFLSLSSYPKQHDRPRPINADDLPDLTFLNIHARTTN
jgi:hypothetical protein